MYALLTPLHLANIVPIGYHCHKCDNCGTVWEHSDQMAGHTKSHECPNCKREQWMKYLGSTAPCVVDG